MGIFWHNGKERLGECETHMAHGLQEGQLGSYLPEEFMRIKSETREEQKQKGLQGKGGSGELRSPTTVYSTYKTQVYTKKIQLLKKAKKQSTEFPAKSILPPKCKGLERFWKIQTKRNSQI